MENNVLLEAALRYAELGYPVFPCIPGTKTPLTEHGFQDATVDAAQIEEWWHFHPSANIGIPTQGLLIVDIEANGAGWLADDPDRLLDLTRGPMSLTAHGGNHRWFRQPAGKGWHCTEKKLAPNVDTRADGGYVVVPPSIVEGNKSYRWAPGMELDEPANNLPVPPAWLESGLDGLANRTPTSATGAAGGDGANKIPSGQRNATLARLAGTMRRVGMSQNEISAALVQTNQDRCSPPLALSEVELIAASIARYEPDQVSTALTENHWEQMYADKVEDSSTIQDPGPIPDHLLHVPGFIDEVMTYALSTAPYPERSLAFCGALALQAFLAGRKVRDRSDNRASIYVLGLANSGAGKEHPRKVNQQILLHAGLADYLGDTFASGEGIEDRLFIQPSVLFQTDEIDGLMSKINLGRDARHEGIMNVLLKMFSSASSIYPMRVKAGREPGIIDQPSLCIFGTAIPKHYYEALSLKMLTNGFFARMLIIETGKRSRGQDAEVRSLPDSVLQTAKWWAKFSPGEKRGNLSDWHPIPMIVEPTQEADAILRDFRESADREYSQAEDRLDSAGMAMWARANEKARRLALIAACSANPNAPKIAPDAAAGRVRLWNTRHGGCSSWRPSTSARTISMLVARSSWPLCVGGARSTATLGCRSGSLTDDIRGTSENTRTSGPHS
jgi:hypothetical protein